MTRMVRTPKGKKRPYAPPTPKELRPWKPDKKKPWEEQLPQALERAETLAKLGYARDRVIRLLGVPRGQEGEYEERFPELTEALNRGYGQCTRKHRLEEPNVWEPSGEDLEKIHELARKGVSERSIAVQFGIDAIRWMDKKKKFPVLQYVLDLARSDMEVNIAEKIYEEAMNGEKTLLIWLSKQCGWSEKPTTVVAGDVNINQQAVFVGVKQLEVDKWTEIAQDFLQKDQAKREAYADRVLALPVDAEQVEESIPESDGSDETAGI